MIGRITPRKLNVDTDERSLSSDEMKNALNLVVSADAEGDGGVVKFSDGNLPISSSDPLSGMNAGENTVVGSVTDEELGVVYFFVHNDQGNHGIYAYSEKTNTYRKIFSDVSLDFDKDGFVKGDVVRVKRNPEIVAPDVVVGQGGEGGVVDIFPEGFNIIDAFSDEEGVPEDFVMPMTDFTVQLVTKIDDIQLLDEDVLSLETLLNKYGDPSSYEVKLEAFVQGNVKILDETSFVSTTSPTNSPPSENGYGQVISPGGGAGFDSFFDVPYTIYKTGVDWMSQDHTPSIFIDENQENSFKIYEGSVYLISKVNFSYPKFFYFSGTIESLGQADGTLQQWTFDQSIAWSFHNMTRIVLRCDVSYTGEPSFSPHSTALEGESVSFNDIKRIQNLTRGYGASPNYQVFGYYSTDSEYNPFASDGGPGVRDYFAVPTSWSREFGYLERLPDDEFFENPQHADFDTYSQYAPLNGSLLNLGALATTLYVEQISSSLPDELYIESTIIRYQEQHKALASKRIVPGTSEIIDITSELDDDGQYVEANNRELSAILRVKIDLSNSSVYQDALNFAEIISNGSTSPEDWPTDVPDAVFRSSTDELPISIFVQTRCPSESSFRLFGSNVEVSRYNVDGSPKSWHDVYIEALTYFASSNPSYYGVETGGIANSDLNNSSNYYNDLGSMISAAEQTLDLPYYSGSEYNFIIVDIPSSPSEFIPGVDDCPEISLGDVFRPTLYYFGVDGDESKYEEYTPLNRVGSTIQEVVAEIQDPVYEFIVNVPISLPIEDESKDGILHLRNKSTVSGWDFQEIVSQEDYDISIYTYDGEDYIPEELKSELSSLSNDLTVNYSFNGGPTQAHNVSGRRIRAPYRTALKSGVDKLSFELPQSMVQYADENGQSPWLTSEPMSDLAPGTDALSPFCFGSSTSCGENLRVVPNVLESSDTSVIEPIDTTVTVNEGDSATDPVRVTETEPDRPVSQSRLNPDPLVTKTKKTIKKKY